MIQRFICATLEQAGYRVQGAAGAEEALSCFAAAPERFQLVLSDVVMPRVTGVDLARRLLNHDPGRARPFHERQADPGFRAAGLRRPRV